jgi:hypothetical protein
MQLSVSEDRKWTEADIEQAGGDADSVMFVLIYLSLSRSLALSPCSVLPVGVARFVYISYAVISKESIYLLT